MQRTKDIFEEHKHRYGYRRITAQLRWEGLKIKVKRLMTKMHLFGLTLKRRAKYSSYRGTKEQLSLI